MYYIIRNILFLFDAEKVHHFTMGCLRFLCKIPLTRQLVASVYQPKKARPVHLWNLHFPNIVGLGAGFDKNAQYLTELETLGFGFVEIGTVTPLPQEGNPKPRLFRLPKDIALINRMGFNNDGVDVIADRLKTWRRKHTKSRLIIGGNIGKNKITPNEKAVQDYEICYEKLYDVVDYFVVNVSSPNTPGLRELQEKESLRIILSALQKIKLTKENKKPLLLKIAPDLTKDQIDDVIDLSLEVSLDGLVVSNTTVDRSELNSGEKKIEKIGAGGVSGKPLQHKSNEWISYIHQRTKGKIPIIGSGGIYSPKSAKNKIYYGATLIQIWTGFVYEGPGLIKKIIRYIK
ncbi:MAG: quinone-dependent dihydroorotate dehydrogenase [Bacteroidota bacterium]|jgi:dihydroorotate dehydrogenase